MVTTVKRCVPSTVEENEVVGTGRPEAPPMAVCWIVASAVDDALISYRRMIILPFSVEDATIVSYAATLAASGSVVTEKPTGSAKAMPASASDTFGGWQGENVHDGPMRATVVPSGQTCASSGHAIGRIGYSTALR